MVKQEGVFQWHIACCPCVGSSGCKYEFNIDYGHTLENKFDITGLGLYGITSSPLFPDFVWVSGDTSFIFKTPIPYDEQNLRVFARCYLDDYNSRIDVRLVCDYQDSYNYHYYEIVTSGHAVYNWNQNAKLGKRIDGVDTVLEESNEEHDSGHSICSPNYLLSNTIGSLCTGDNALYGYYNTTGLHSPTVLHSGTKVGIIISNVKDAHFTFNSFQVQDHTDWSNEIPQKSGFGPPECVDCGRCGCAGESPASYRVLIQGLKKGIGDFEVGWECCSEFDGTYVMEQWGRDLNASEYSAEENASQYCYYYNEIDNNPCGTEYVPAFLELSTQAKLGELSISARLFECRPNFLNDYAITFGRWKKNYGDPIVSGILCSQLSYESIPFIGAMSLSGYYKYYPCSGDEISCQVSAL